MARIVGTRMVGDPPGEGLYAEMVEGDRYRYIKFNDYFGRGEERSDMGGVYIETKKKRRKRKDEFYRALEPCTGLITGIDWCSQPDVGCWYEREVFIAPGEAPQVKYSKLPNQDNAAMIHADIYGDAERRFRPCQNCHEDFKFKELDQWLCPLCAGLRKEMERRQGVEGDLLNANKVLK